MEFYSSHSTLKTGWTYDAIATQDKIGSIREPLVVVTASGLEAIPTTIQYSRRINGDRNSPLLDGRFARTVFEYGRASFYKEEPEVKKFLIWDEEAKVSLLALPLLPDTRVFSARKIMDHILETGSDHAKVLERICNYFPKHNFGLLGSWSALLANENSDLDLFVYGGAQFADTVEALRDTDVQQSLQIRPVSEERQNKYATDYSKRFNIPFDKAKRIALLRSRYMANVENRREIKIAFSGCFAREEYQAQTILGSRKVSNISEQGIAVATNNSASFPREYVVEIDGQPIRVIAMEWVLQKMVEDGDRVKIQGILREKDGVQFISLEEQEDIIVQI